jgi:hypothetical protein
MNILLILASQVPVQIFHEFILSVPFNDINKKALIIFFLIIYFILVAIVTMMGSRRKIGLRNSFITSTLLTPIIGFFIVSVSTKSRKSKSHSRKSGSSSSHRGIHIYKCKYCGYKSQEKFDICPLCGKTRGSSDSQK